MDLVASSGIAEGIPQVFPARSDRPAVSSHRRRLEHPEDQVAVMDGDRMREGVERADALPRLAVPMRLDRAVVADRHQLTSPGREREQALRVARLADVLPAPGAVISVDPACPELLVVDACPVVVPRRRVQLLSMDNQRPDPRRPVGTDLAEVLPLALAEVAKGVPAIRFPRSVRCRRVDAPLEHRERVADVVRGRRRPAEVMPAWLAARVDPEGQA